MLMACLCGGFGSMTLMGRGLFCGSRSSGRSTVSAVVADVVSRPLVAYGFFIRVVKVPIHVIHRSVVAELVVSPVSTLVAITTVAIAVVNAAVESDSRAPVAGVPGVRVAAPTPVTRRPQHANHGRLDPCARHPVIAFRTV